MDIVVNDIVALIPARSGSQRIPNKNITDFQGKPLISHTIEAAISSQVFKNVYVSTDSEKIANIANQYGANVPFLRDKYSDNNSTVSQVIADFISNMEIKGSSFEALAMLMPTCPLRSKIDIINSVNNFYTKNLDTQISGVEYGHLNPLWAHRIHEIQPSTPLFQKEKWYKRTQDLEKLYCLTGAVWCLKTKTFMQRKDIYDCKYHIFPLQISHSIDIDTFEDFKLASYYYKMNEKFSSNP